MYPDFGPPKKHFKLLEKNLGHDVFVKSIMAISKTSNNKIELIRKSNSSSSMEQILSRRNLETQEATLTKQCFHGNKEISKSNIEKSHETAVDDLHKIQIGTAKQAIIQESKTNSWSMRP
jgi:hypothetical protein